jgi:diphosphomevalonate decarboxylase
VVAEQSVLVRAPSNIALVKYMGKNDSSRNLPANSSLSMTLQDLCTVAMVSRTRASGSQIVWSRDAAEKLEIRTARGMVRALPPKMSEQSLSRIIRHVERVRTRLPEIFSRHGLEVTSPTGLSIAAANTFPASSGIASSASSFAAMTLGTAAVFARSLEAFLTAFASGSLREDLAALSREGSGSSCRSFDGPWVRWSGADARKVESAVMPEMSDIVIVVSSAAKAVTSSAAHSRVSSSFLWSGRPERAEVRVKSLVAALAGGDLEAVSHIAWDDFWDMHSLFHTANPPFSYFEPGTIAVLKWLMVQDERPIVTMDAGANIHVLVPSADASGWRQRISSAFPQYELLEDKQGLGASLVDE